MNPDFQPHKGLSLVRLSEGAESYTIREEGIFVVLTEGGCNMFQTLVGAFMFYLGLGAEAVIVDRTDSCDIFIEAKRFLN